MAVDILFPVVSPATVSSVKFLGPEINAALTKAALNVQYQDHQEGPTLPCYAQAVQVSL
jgi:hypothetical protein